VQKLMSLEPFGTAILTLLKLLPYVTLWGAFSFVYAFVPNTRVKLKAALVGGLLAAILWQTVGWGFAAFVASSPRYDAVYSSFAILLLFLLWLHVGWVIVLLGAQVAYVYQHLHLYQEDRDALAATPAGREQLALHMMFLIGRNFYHGLDPMSVSELAHQLGLPAGIVGDFMETFHRGRLVLPLADEETFVLGRDPETIGIKDILDCVRNAGASQQSPGKRTKEEQGIDEIFAEMDQSVAEVLEGKNLQSLILSQSPPPRR
jgi:membrane protein